MPPNVFAGYRPAVNLSSDDATYVTTGGINKANWAPKRATLDASHFAQGDNAIHSIMGVTDGQATLGGDWLYSDAGQAKLLAQFFAGGDLFTEVLSDGVKGFKVKALASQIALKGTMSGKVTLDATLDFNGAYAAVTDSIHSGSSAQQPLAGNVTTLNNDVAVVTMTAEACTQVGSTQTWRITNTAHERIDPRTTINVKDGGVTVDPANIANINVLFGKVTFIDAFTPGGAITIDGKYVTVAPLLVVNEWGFTAKRAMLDRSSMGDSFMRKIAGLLSADLSIKSMSEPTDEYSTGLEVWTDFIAGTPKLVQIDLNGAGTAGVIRAWMNFPTLTKDMPFTGIQSTSLAGTFAHMQPVHPTALGYTSALSIDAP